MCFLPTESHTDIWEMYTPTKIVQQVNEEAVKDKHLQEE